MYSTCRKPLRCTPCPPIVLLIVLLTQDTAEMYPVPTEASTQGSTDRYIGSWLKGRKRDSVVLASKVGGFMRGLSKGGTLYGTFIVKC